MQSRMKKHFDQNMPVMLARECGDKDCNASAQDANFKKPPMPITPLMAQQMAMNIDQDGNFSPKNMQTSLPIPLLQLCTSSRESTNA